MAELKRQRLAMLCGDYESVDIPMENRLRYTEASSDMKQRVE